MSQIVLGHDKQVAEWAWSRMPIDARLKGDYVAFGFADEGKLVIGVVFSNHRLMKYGSEISIGISVDSPRHVTRGNIRSVLAYPFIQLGCVRLTAFTGRKMKRVRRFLEGMGCHIEGVHRHAYDGRQDAISYGMLREDAARWLGSAIENK